MKKKIDPSKATPQASLKLRAAEAPGAPPPDKEAEPADAKEAAGDNTDALASCAEACRTASAACTSAAEQLDACAKELDAGTDSISTLTATESACAEADAALDAASEQCAGLRGAEPPADSERAPALPTGANVAPVVRSASAPTVAGHLALAKLAQLGSATLSALGQADPVAAMAMLGPRLKLSAQVMSALGQTDPVRARGVLASRLELATQAEGLQAQLGAKSVESDGARREKLWEQAVADGRVQMQQAFTRIDGAEGPVRVYAKFAVDQNAAYPELAAFEGWISSRVKETRPVAETPSQLLADVSAERLGRVQLTERDIAEAKRAGVDPAALAAQIKISQRGPGAAADQHERA